MKLTTASIMQLLDEIQQFDLYKQLRYKFGIVKEGEPLYYIFNSGYTSRLIENREEQMSRLQEHVIEAFEEWELEPIFIIDKIWGKGLYLIEDYSTERADLEDLKEKNRELYKVISRVSEYGVICFRRTETSSLFSIMQELDYCNMFSSEGKDYDFTETATIVIENVDSESG
jgi:hypothetical protein